MLRSPSPERQQRVGVRIDRCLSAASSPPRCQTLLQVEWQLRNSKEMELTVVVELRMLVVAAVGNYCCLALHHQRRAGPSVDRPAAPSNPVDAWR